MSTTTNEQLTKDTFESLGIFGPNRRPYAKEIFKVYDIDLLPHASEDTIIGEIFEWSGRTFRSTGDNIIGIITNDAEKIERLNVALTNINRFDAAVPDFEFSKEEIIDMGFKLPFLLNINFTGNFQNAKDISVKINSLKKARITNIKQPGIEIKSLLSSYALQNTREYREKIKNNWISEALFYAGSVEIVIDKQAGVDIGVSFDVKNVEVSAEVDTDVKKHYKLTYKGDGNIPFGATLKRGKDLFV